MNEIEIQTKLAELMTEKSTLPATERKKLEQLADETRQRHERLRATVSSLQESLDYLRLSIKYLVFDLEATRRENGYHRKMLEETSGNDSPLLLAAPLAERVQRFSPPGRSPGRPGTEPVRREAGASSACFSFCLALPHEDKKKRTSALGRPPRIQSNPKTYCRGRPSYSRPSASTV
jgi:hypothetical protein